MGRPPKSDAEFVARALELAELSEHPRCQMAAHFGGVGYYSCQVDETPEK